jgi:hypothetical protein
VIDRYHVAHLLVDGVDRVRRHEHAQLRSRRDERLKGTRYMWIKGPMKRGADDELRIAELSRSGLRVGRAWALKEAASDLWAYRSRAWALGPGPPNSGRRLRGLPATTERCHSEAFIRSVANMPDGHVSASRAGAPRSHVTLNRYERASAPI